MKVSTALATRISCRAFLDRPVPEATVRAILDAARRAPSGGNLQPWHVYALTAAPLRELLAQLDEKWRENPLGEPTEYDIYPKNLGEPYRSRRHKCGEDLYATLGIPRSDRPARLRHFSRNLHFFDAPVGLFFAIDRQMGQDQWADMGMYLQSVMLLAREHGLHSCPQEYWAMWHGAVSAFLHLPDELMLFCGMALGYMDPAAPVNRLRTERAPLDDIAHLIGF